MQWKCSDSSSSGNILIPAPVEIFWFQLQWKCSDSRSRPLMICRTSFPGLQHFHFTCWSDELLAAVKAWERGYKDIWEAKKVKSQTMRAMVARKLYHCSSWSINSQSTGRQLNSHDCWISLPSHLPQIFSFQPFDETRCSKQQQKRRSYSNIVTYMYSVHLVCICTLHYQWR